jgi:hypothetical protein
VLHDRRRGTFTSVLAVRGGAFAPLDLDDKQRRLAAWANVLASLARTGSPVARLQWVERTMPAGSGRLPPPPTPSGGGSCAASYAELIDDAGPVTQEHEVFIALSLGGRPAARSIRRGGGGEAGACALVARELRLLEGQLRTAEITVDRVLGPDELQSCLRRAYAPEVAPWLPPRTAAFAPWPMATEVTWSSYRTDAAWHATYWVAEWPRVEVGPDFLAPLLLQSAGCRTVSVVMAPVAPGDAARAVEAAKTADAADDELRRRAGFLATARRRRQAEGVLRREAELADGHAEYRYAGYVSVTAADPEELDRACAEVEQTAQHAHLDLRRLFGRQEDAFAWTLPVGRGLA